ncbi:TetR family transcriptional regulator [Frankia sp. CNm7]|uniref:TetR family transcriptional regulator n=1 Tax=Frankia nepalensis TaxID=1836974 RepID=A0A937RAV2_9ACTN|nr:TetR/AcrR family transcriptional regulator [Frankia nepalensis]MBL7496829.1 TetR family transcriptional regulator [Frankia nepalensis]MBL7510960.1 TetR family transcriptional regulator [Frankia nepalensis]MBL7522552.1 TetR family transcriptional regulator [Frankia nepalensis]MBL7626917.1 TetR family transcriptional regulator [Frankia nepalensis]
MEVLDATAPAGVTQPGELGLRERKKRQTRQAIRDAAVRLVADRGLERVTVDEIAEAANVSPRTFFNYFRSKEDALVGIDNDEIEETCVVLRARLANQPPLAALAEVLTARLERKTANPQLHLARVQMHHSHPQLSGAHAATWRHFERRLAEVIAERLGVSAEEHPYPRTLVFTAMAVVRAVITHWQRGVEPTAEGLAAELRAGFDSLARGLPPPEPAEPSAPAPAARPAATAGP